MPCTFSPKIGEHLCPLYLANISYVLRLTPNPLIGQVMAAEIEAPGSL